MISRIQAIQYRCFAQLDVTLHNYNILAGANGTGKSTLIDIPLILRDMLVQGIIPAFLGESCTIHATRAQSLQELTHCYRGNYFGFALETPLSQDITRALIESAPTTLQADRKRWPQLLRYDLQLAPNLGIIKSRPAFRSDTVSIQHFVSCTKFYNAGFHPTEFDDENCKI